jgi:hypothetical protein
VSARLVVGADGRRFPLQRPRLRNPACCGNRTDVTHTSQPRRRNVAGSRRRGQTHTATDPSTTRTTASAALIQPPRNHSIPQVVDGNLVMNERDDLAMYRARKLAYRYRQWVLYDVTSRAPPGRPRRRTSYLGRSTRSASCSSSIRRSAASIGCADVRSRPNRLSTTTTAPSRSSAVST